MTTSSRQGLIYAITAFVIWGVAPAYFKLVASVPPAEIIVHRILWSTVVMALVLSATRRFVGFGFLRANPKIVGTLFLTAALITTNWLTFVYAINSNHMLDASLGYYINPLVNVLLAVLFLGERLRPLQLVAVALAIMGVGYQVVELGRLPWISLVLAFSFGFYGLLRKKVALDALNGLAVETALAAPFALIYFGSLWHSGAAHFGQGGGGLEMLLMLAGIVTTVPLALYAAGARQLSFTTIGFLQYIGPSISMLLAVFVYGEHFSTTRAVTFGFIWAGLALFSIDALRARLR